MIKMILIGLMIMMNAHDAYGGINFEPYFSYRSTKGITSDRSKGTETETIKNREEKGIRGGIGFFSLLKIQASVGQSFTVTTKKTNQISDEYDEIDFEKELNYDPNSEVKDLKTKETDSRANISVIVDPSFWIFIARAKIGVSARQRVVKVFEGDTQVLKKEPPITYKPVAGAGLGVKFSYNMYAIAEYSVYFYKFPEPEPFERSVSLSLGFSI